ncbi:serine/threonine-protein kinase pknF [Mycolicibacterium hassiacum DSM 44199]|uniref:non-specific serine/threonine protein kinase n=1 Tax=Mycolicibacterium hassiacum (strain DSM 44199 / CIP 105218 / JCM 12690 / 3849) TaxID=1122247 RepID=K5BH34_MYCHD|nr:serine/threonine-protein kinase [Mycolicibacterium hassiacum]EKF25312.1 serine/threonine-protein kinase pknF [Mycolicibacterium hassiacum DSM 44199]
MPIAEGAEFAGYRIVRRLGSGGMGEVYLVQHPRLPRLEALKVLPANVSADPEFRQRFEREADVAASLWHPHIVSVHDRGEHDGQLWITMDYVDGTDVVRLLRERYPGGMPANEALEIISAVAEALDYAYERQLLHRDVKPANILVAESRSARRIALADFGIAKMANETHGLTATNMTIGSVAYAAPEQLTGAHLDGRADQYALACTAFHMLTGRPPFADQNPAAVIGKQLSEPPPPLGGLRPDLVSMEPVLARAMAKDPVQRFGSCREFAAALRLGASRPGQNRWRPPARLRPHSRRPRRHPRRRRPRHRHPRHRRPGFRRGPTRRGRRTAHRRRGWRPSWASGSRLCWRWSWSCSSVSA